MQEVIGALFGWINILAGRIYTVGDRVDIARTRGDVMDITPLRTTLMEIGSPAERAATPVAARQPTGRVATVPNRKTFTDPVVNYSAHFDWIWNELTFTVSVRQQRPFRPRFQRRHHPRRARALRGRRHSHGVSGPRHPAGALRVSRPAGRRCGHKALPFVCAPVRQASRRRAAQALHLSLIHISEPTRPY